MATQEALLSAVSEDAVCELQLSLAAAPDAHRLMWNGWRWYHAYAGVDVLGVATLGPPEPIGFLLADGPLDSGTQEWLWQQLVQSAVEAWPQPGMYPRRAGDRRVWRGSSPLPVELEAPAALGPWTAQAAGAPAAVVQAWQATARPVEPSVSALLPTAAALTTLYLRNVQWLDIEPEPDPTGPLTFEELLESEVARARRKRVAVSLALVEFRLRNHSSFAWEIPADLHDEVEDVVKQTARKGDRVMAISDCCIAVVMPKTDARGALVGADRLQAALQGHFADHEPGVTVQVGIGGKDPEETQGAELFARASQALAEARFAGSEAAFLHV